MAMNKSEKTAMDDLRQELAIAKALRMTDEVEPDLKPPESFGVLVKGWIFNSYSLTVNRACTSNVNHSHGSDTATTSKGTMCLYSTKLLALKAMRSQAAREFAVKLATIDKKIEEESRQ